MTTLTLPTFEGRLLQSVSAELKARPVSNWPGPSFQLCLDLIGSLCENGARLRQDLEQILAQGVETGLWKEHCGALVSGASEQVTKVRETIGLLGSADDPDSARLRAGLQLLEQETVAYFDLLTASLARASEPPRPIHWDRVRASEAAYSRGETKLFSPD